MKSLRLVTLLCCLLIGVLNGLLVAKFKLPPFIATLGMMVSARGLARYYTEGQPVSMLSDSYTAIGHGAMPVIIFFVTISHSQMIGSLSGRP